MSLWVTFQQKCEARAAAHRAIASDTPYYSQDQAACSILGCVVTRVSRNFSKSMTVAQGRQSHA